MIIPVLIAIGAGLLTGIGWWMSFRAVIVGMGRRLLRPSRKKGGKGWLRGTLFVLSGQLPMAIWVVLLIISPLTHLALSFFLPAGTAVIGGLVATCGGILELLTERKKLIAIERTLLPVAVDRLLNYASVEYTTKVLEYILHSPDAIFRLAAANGLSTLATEKALKLLSAATNDPDLDVRTAATRGSEAIRKSFGAGQALSVKAMPTLFQEHEQLTAQLDHLHGAEFKAAARRVIEVEHMMTEVVNAQMALRNAFPHLWCTRCNARTTEARYTRWRYVHCRRCLDALDIRINVRKVTGTIGLTQDQSLDKRDLAIALWSPGTQTAHFAEIDRLEIFPGTDLDAGVAAVLARLQAEWPDRAHAIEVKQIGQPMLSAETRASLETLQIISPASGTAGGPKAL
jgi:hypothetical protein